MIPELGQYALILALCMAIIQAIVPLVGTFNRTPGWVALARPVAWGQFFFLVIAFAVLTHAFLVNDFSVFMSLSMAIPSCRLSTRSRLYGARMKDRCCCGC